MYSTIEDTAILIFARHPSDEADVKAWLGKKNHRGNTRFARRLLHGVQGEAQATGLPVLLISSDKQQGSSFGERFHNAFQSVFEMGYEKVIAIGSDCPQINRKHLIQAAAHLETGLVLGPDFRGGDYLIGMDLATFQAINLKDIAWQSPLVHRQLAMLASVYCLPALADIHTKSDVWTLLNKLGKTKWLRWIQNLLQTVPNSLCMLSHPARTASPVFIYSRRGPPAI